MECPICLDYVTDEQLQTVLPCCKKIFHTECYLKCSNPCPLCRSANFICIDMPSPVDEVERVSCCKIAFNCISTVIVSGFLVLYFVTEVRRT